MTDDICEQLREQLIDARDQLVEMLFKFPRDHPSAQEIMDALIKIDDVLEKTETDPVAIMIRQIGRMPAEDLNKILKAPDWKTRWLYGAGMVGAMILAARDQGMEDADRDELVGLFSKALATWLVDELGRPEIADPYQAFISRLHADDGVRDASIEWRNQHQDEMVPFDEMLSGGWRH